MTDQPVFCERCGRWTGGLMHHDNGTMVHRALPIDLLASALARVLKSPPETMRERAEADAVALLREHGYGGALESPGEAP